MCAQLEAAVWTAIPVDCRRRLITRLSQLACRQLTATIDTAGGFHEWNDSGSELAERQD